MTEFDGQDACGSNSWAIADVDAPRRPTDGKKAEDPGHLISSLKPWTQYAIMVKTQLSASDEHEVHGAKSEIIYVRTNASSKSCCFQRVPFLTVPQGSHSSRFIQVPHRQKSRSSSSCFLRMLIGCRKLGSCGQQM